MLMEKRKRDDDTVSGTTNKKSMMHKDLVKWSFGVGQEGIKAPMELKDACVIVDSMFPCWWAAVKAIGLNVLNVWLTSDQHPFIEHLQTLLGNTFVTIGSDLTQRVRQDLEKISWLVIGNDIPKTFASLGIWKLKNLMVIITSKALNHPTPSGWYTIRTRVSHAEVGGVTDGVHYVHIHTRRKVEGHLTLSGAPRQDLRSILKTGESGMCSSNMFLPATNEAASTVNYCGTGVVNEYGLLPHKSFNIKVRTQWRSRLWIHRSLTLFEWLLALDVPEKLIRVVPESLHTILLKSVHSPSKVLHATIQAVHQHVHELPTAIQAEFAIKDISVANSRKIRRFEADDVVSDSLKYKRLKIWSSALTAIEEIANESDGYMTSDTVTPDYNDKATKNDDAVVRTKLWDEHLFEGCETSLRLNVTTAVLFTIRTWVLRVWKRRVTRSYFTWASLPGSLERCGIVKYSLEARDCIRRSADASWWNWDVGSRPFFWRWPEEYWSVILHGIPVWMDGQIKPWTRKQRESLDPIRRKLIAEKLNTIQVKGYVEIGPITSLMSFFDVPKGADDIRMVYDGTASGLNGFLWAPWFSLPTVECLLRSLEPGYSMSDNDVGEMFHNFMLHKDLRKYCGLDITQYSKDMSFNRSAGKRVWIRWNRLAMGLRPSPYSAVQGMMMAREVILGDRHDDMNVFRWDRVRLNLPGSDSYTPSKAWVTKVREDGKVAADVFIYVDDIRCSAPTKHEAWLASQRTSSTLGFLGLQDAARKRRDPGQKTGAWTGSVVRTSGDTLSVMTTQEKWEKTKQHLHWMVQNMDNKGGLSHKKLQSIRGFLVYVSRTYGTMVPYLKGIHATIDSWRPGRSETGWKLKKPRPPNSVPTYSEENHVEWDVRLGVCESTDTEPAFVFPVPRFRNDIKCLLALTESTLAPKRMGRMKDQARVIYGFGDASKHGFGASIELPDKSIYWRFGQWRLEEEYKDQHPDSNHSIVDERSSNYRELRNLVEALESSFAGGILDNREVFMFTDNSTAEAAFFKGTSSSELLFELVLRLRILEMSGRCVIHMIHIAGTRMIHQGTDGLSRGDKTSGVMAGESMLSFVPLHLSVFNRSPTFEQWLDETLSIYENESVKTRFLKPCDWPESHENGGIFVWSPPPAAADVAIDYMAQSIHKRTSSTHIYICPRLMTSRWHRVVRKATDLFFTIPIGSDLWDTSQHEPLIFCISFPLSRDRPWKHGGTVYCDHIGKVLPSLFKENISGARSMLRECITQARGMAKM